MKVIDINGQEREVKEVIPDPDYPGFMKLQFRRHHEWLSINEFIKLNPDLTHLADKALKVPDDVVGIATSAGNNFLRDSNQNWDKNAYMGMFVWISRGKGEGQKRTVIKNSKNQVFTDKPWDIKPDKTSQYVISYNVQEVKPMGNTGAQDNMKDLERLAIKIDRRRGRLNKEYKYLKPEEVD